MLVICRKNGGNCSYFTDGNAYEVLEDYSDGNVLIVDDKGKEREVETNGTTSHIQKRYNRKSGATYRPVGVFTIAPEDEEPVVEPS